MVIMANLLVTFIIYGFFRTIESAGVTFDYSNPSAWKNNFEICGFKSQSPISLPPIVDMTYDGNMDAFSLTNFDKPVSTYNLTIKNTGGSVKVDIDGEVGVSGGGLPYKYKLKQFHFHWGSDDTKGSEHTYNGQAYPLELHLVTYNSYKYSDFDSAADKDDGLAVLGFFFEIDNEVSNCNYGPLLEYFAQISAKDATQNVSAYKLRHLMPANLDHFYRYKGSLTTPPCYESVTWTVFRDKIPITSEQMKLFRSLFTDTSQTVAMVNNYRPVQPLNGRKVTTNIYIPETVDPNAAPVTRLNVFLTITFVLATFLFV